MFVTKASHTVIVVSAVAYKNSQERDGLRQAELCPRTTIMKNINNFLIDQTSKKDILIVQGDWNAVRVRATLDAIFFQP